MANSCDGKADCSPPKVIEVVATAIRLRTCNGTPGIGRTELARALAEYMFDSEDALIKLDMSEFMERHATARLVGSPPRLRRLRGGQPADRGSAPPPLTQ